MISCDNLKFLVSEEPLSAVKVILLVIFVLIGLIRVLKIQDQIRQWIVGAVQKKRRVSAKDYPLDSVQYSIAMDIQKRQEFEHLTGINIHPDRIEAIIELRNKSNGSFDFPKIRSAKDFIKFTNKGAVISITVWDKLLDFFTVILFSFAIFLFVALFALTTFSVLVNKEPDSNRDIFLFIFCFIGVFGSLFFMQYIRSNYLAAKFIKEKLK